MSRNGWSGHSMTPHDVLNLWSPIDGYLLPLFNYLAGSKSQILLKKLSRSSGKNSKNVRLSDPVTTTNADWLLLQVQLTRLRLIEGRLMRSYQSAAISVGLAADWRQFSRLGKRLHRKCYAYGLSCMGSTVASPRDTAYISGSLKSNLTKRSQDHSFPVVR